MTHVVQAYCTGLGWVEHKALASKAEAEVAEATLLANDDAWMPSHFGPNAMPRRTRVVPVPQGSV